MTIVKLYNKEKKYPQKIVTASTIVYLQLSRIRYQSSKILKCLHLKMIYQLPKIWQNKTPLRIKGVRSCRGNNYANNFYIAIFFSVNKFLSEKNTYQV